MGNLTLAETIQMILRDHMENNDGLVLGQTLSSIGNTYGTIPFHKNVIEMPMTDVAAAGIAVGASLVGRRPVFVLRFQDFFLLNSSPLLQDAALGKEYHGVPSPVFIRSIATDKSGPCHSNVMHSLVMQFPGIKVCAPMTPGEYRGVWDHFMSDDVPCYVSEHRKSYGIRDELKDVINDEAEITLFGILDTRLELEAAAQELSDQGFRTNIVHITWLKPLEFEKLSLAMEKSRIGLVVDSSREMCGVSRDIAFRLMHRSKKPVYALAGEDYVKCLNPAQYHAAPDARAIAKYALAILREEE